MCRIPVLLFLTLFLVAESPSWSQCCRRTCGGNNHGKTLQRSTGSLLESHRADLVLNQTIAQYTKFGCQLEANKKWDEAEKVFHYMIQLISKHDGPGSFRSLEALEHLAAVSRAQNKFDQAIGSQKTACLLRERYAASDKEAILDAQLSLANLYIQKHDYVGAEKSLNEAIELCNVQAAKPLKHRDLTYKVYAKVLRELHKDSEAETIEASANHTTSVPVANPNGNNNQAILTHSPTSAFPTKPDFPISK